MNDILVYTEDDVDKIREMYGITNEKLADSLVILKKWISQERHLPQNQDDSILERFLVKNKFRMEQAKKKIEAYYTLRGKCKEFRQEFNDDVIPSKEIVFGIPLARLTHNQQRIFLIKLQNSSPDLFDLSRIMKFLTLVMEIGFKYDYNNGEIILIDLDGITVDHLKKINPIDLGRAINLAQIGYSGRPVSVNVVNAPKFVATILSLLKLALPTKLYSKINIHNDLRSLYKICPEKCLPKDYGGDLDWLEVISYKWDEVFATHSDFFKTNFKDVSDENLRVGYVETNEIFGMNGTFKKLNLD